MRVLHITSNYPTPEHPVFGIFVKEQVDSLRAVGVDCDVLYCDKKGHGSWAYITYVPRIWWRILTGHYDVIHCHHVLSGLLCIFTFWPLFKKCVLSFQNDPSREGHFNSFWFVYCFFNRIILKNPSKYLKYRRTVYLPNGCNEYFFTPLDKAECRRKLGLDADSVYILFMDSNSRVRKQKRKDRFDECLELLRPVYPNVKAIELYNTPRESIPYYMNACDLHLLSSDFEGSPNSVKECLCCNTPVVATDVGNVKEMIGDIPGCFVVDDPSPQALADAVRKVLEMQTRFDGRTAFLAKGYGLSVVADKLKALYTEIS